MTTVETYDSGKFCWVELSTTDLRAARDFYSRIFGWQSQTETSERFGEYATFTVADGGAAAGGYTQQEAERSMGVPPHWNLYVSTDDVDKHVTRATELGGEATIPGLDTPLGRMAVIADPTGARLCLWQSQQMPGFKVRNEHGAFTWADLITPEKDRALEFYGDLFGWTGETLGEEFGNYTLISQGEEQIGGFMNPTQPGQPPAWLPYFAVDDAQAVSDSATAGGAQIFVPPTPIPTVGTFAVIADPQGAVFAVLQAEANQST